jgi:hypothetical protein
MIVMAVVAVLASQSGQLLPAPWQQGQRASNQYAVYGRPEPDGTFSVLTGTKQLCNCQPATLLADMMKDLRAPGVTMVHDTRTMCGASAQHLVATGVATSDKSTQNVDAFMFRKGSAAYILMYRFRYAQPKADEEKALSALCPQ